MGSQPDKKVNPDCQPPIFLSKISVSGVVQGVGFRPYIFRLAQLYRLTGTVCNTVSGVFIEAEGAENDLKSFTQSIPRQKPPNAIITSLDISFFEPIPQKNHLAFTILTSSHTGTRTVMVPPDLDICDDCLRGLFTPDNRRYCYPFINCTNCGPRYTIIENLPYDRPATSMKSFKLCSECAAEYKDPLDRRFHAQPNACPVCGPQLTLANAQGQIITGHPISHTRKLLLQGKIVAIKGIGGFHLAVDANNKKAVDLLRKRKKRPDKPFALMAKDLQTVQRFAKVSALEKSFLASTEKPIVLLEKKPSALPDCIAPRQRYIGVMLPYSPVHHLLFNGSDISCLVMTSGNLSEEPIIIDNADAHKKLRNVADFFLTHNRNILTSNDDSIVKSVDGKHLFLRRSRSYAPVPLHFSFDAGQTLAVGGSMKNTICLTKGGQYYLSQHIGDLKHFESIRHFESVIKHLSEMLLITPDLIVHDLHPDYPSTRYALQSGIQAIGVQHHHAHAVSCMAENNITDPVLAITLDGTGFGTDGTIWGGEILIADHLNFTRAAHLSQFKLPGGDEAVKNPWRTAVSCLYQILGEKILECTHPVTQLYKENLPTLVAMIDKNINSPVTSSCGRLFDCVAALTGLRQHSTYEGQAALELEMTISHDDNSFYPFEIVQENGSMLLSWEPMLHEILADLRKNTSPGSISNRFHNTLAALFSEACGRLGKTEKIQSVVLSGGVFQNGTLLERLTRFLTDQNFKVHSHHKVPPNDGGLCLGQAVAGRARMTEGMLHKSS
jgi:hydrogenase maturation protein HypF